MERTSHAQPCSSSASAAIFAAWVFLFLATLVLLAFAAPAHAQDSAEFATFGDTTILTQTPLSVIIARLIRGALGVLGIVSVIIVMYGGAMWMASGGDPGKLKTAKKILTNGLIGLVIILSAFVITTFIIKLLIGDTSGGQATHVETARRYFEPLSGSLGAGIINDHFPVRDAFDVPRNTTIFVTFKEPIDPATIIRDFGQDQQPATDGFQESTRLHEGNVRIFPTDPSKGAALGSDAVNAYVSTDRMTFVFDPVGYLGSATDDINYTVALGSGIKKATGENAFGNTRGFESANGYEWTFEVSTELDLDPPEVVSVFPQGESLFAPNALVEITFNEPMNPITVAGTVTGGIGFDHVTIVDTAAPTSLVDGAFVVSNGYRTIGFTPTVVCGIDPCGNDLYCLPFNKTVAVHARAATLSEPGTVTAYLADRENAPLPNPQSRLFDGFYDGVVDASGNSLNGQGPEVSVAEGRTVDDYAWDFATTNKINDTPAIISSLSPNIFAEDIGLERPVEITFTDAVSSASLNTTNIQIWPEPKYEFWFRVTKKASGDATAVIDHPTMVAREDGGAMYYPVITHGVKSAYGICMYPAKGPATGANAADCGVDSTNPNCCADVNTRTQSSQGTVCSPPN